MNTQEMTEMVEKLRKRQENNLTYDEIIEICFSIIEFHPDDIEKARAAVILSGIVQRSLAIRTKEFLKKNPELPSRVQEILNASLLRMAGY